MFTKYLKLITLVAVLSLVLLTGSVALAQTTPPTPGVCTFQDAANFPGCNPPINTGIINQIKAGGLGVGTFGIQSSGLINTASDLNSDPNEPDATRKAPHAGAINYLRNYTLDWNGNAPFPTNIPSISPRDVLVIVGAARSLAGDRLVKIWDNLDVVGKITANTVKADRYELCTLGENCQEFTGTGSVDSRWALSGTQLYNIDDSNVLVKRDLYFGGGGSNSTSNSSGYLYGTTDNTILSSIGAKNLILSAGIDKDLTLSKRRQISNGTTMDPLMTLKSSGNVGISNTAPSTLLEVGNSSYAGPAYVSANSAADRVAGFRWRDAGTDIWHLFKSNNGSRDLALRNSAGADVIAFKQDGNVGIGTNNPAAKLHIGTVNDGKSLRIEGPTAANGDQVSLSLGGNGEVRVDKPGTEGGRFIIKDNGNVGIGLDTADPGVTLDVRNGVGRFGGLVIPPVDSANNVIDLGADSDEANAGKIAYKKFGDMDALDIVGAGIEYLSRKVRLYDDVEVVSDLLVNGTTTTNTLVTNNICDGEGSCSPVSEIGDSNWTKTATGEGIFNSNTGSVGIGKEPSPLTVLNPLAQRLQVNGGISLTKGILGSEELSLLSLSSSISKGASITLTGKDDDSNGITFNAGTLAEEEMRITGDGKVEIGEIDGSPDLNTKLDINGFVKSNGITFGGMGLFPYEDSLLLDNPNGGLDFWAKEGVTFSKLDASGFSIPVMKIDNLGNVGIGTISPTTKLDVAGKVKIDSYPNNPTSLYDVWIQGGSDPDNNGGNDRNLALLGMKTGDKLVLNHAGEYTGGVNIQSTTTIAGNVGIGTDNPIAKLDVAGSLKLDAYPNNTENGYDVWIQGGSGDFGTSRNLALVGQKSDDTLFLNWNGEYTGGVKVGSKMKVDWSGEKAISWGENYNETGYLGSDRLDNAVFQSANALNFRTSQGSKMVITNAGLVGIGTTHPGSTLDVNGTLNVNGPISWWSAGRLSKDESGNALIITDKDFKIRTWSGVDRLIVKSDGVRIAGPAPDYGGDLNVGGEIIAEELVIPDKSLLSYANGDIGLELGWGKQGKETNAGRIRYEGWTTGALDIVGAGTEAGDRWVKIWDNLKVSDIRANNLCNADGSRCVPVNDILALIPSCTVSTYDTYDACPSACGLERAPKTYYRTTIGTDCKSTVTGPFTSTVNFCAATRACVPPSMEVVGLSTSVMASSTNYPEIIKEVNSAGEAPFAIHVLMNDAPAGTSCRVKDSGTNITGFSSVTVDTSFTLLPVGDTYRLDLVCDSYTTKSVIAKVKPIVSFFQVNQVALDKTIMRYQWQPITIYENSFGNTTCKIERAETYYERVNGVKTLIKETNGTYTLSPEENIGNHYLDGPCDGNELGDQWCNARDKMTCTSDTNGLSGEKSYEYLSGTY